MPRVSYYKAESSAAVDFGRRVIFVYAGGIFRGITWLEYYPGRQRGRERVADVGSAALLITWSHLSDLCTLSCGGARPRASAFKL